MLLGALKREPAAIISGQAVELDHSDLANAPALSAIASTKSFETSLAERAQELRELGLSEDYVAAALIPSLTRHLRSECLRQTSVEDCASALSRARGERRDWIEETFPDRIDRDWIESPYRSDRLELEFRFDAAIQGKRARSGGEKVAPSAGEHELVPADGPKAIHAVLGKIGGVELDRDEKAALVQIAQTYRDDPAQLRAELSQVFDPATTEQLLRCLDADYHHSYQRAVAVSSDLAERERFATALAEIRHTRLEGLERWEAADLSDAEKSAGRRTVESQIQKYLHDELGAVAVELIRANGW